jgi:alpha-tubulin suppressor-like RCC1 family protein
MDRYTPFALTGSYSAVSIGGAHSVALDTTNGGNIWAWGYNINGQLGNGTINTSLTPIQITGITGVTAIAAGGNHTLALKADRSVWAWGSNSQGQLGDGTNTKRLTPVQVMYVSQPLSGVVAIAAGGQFSLALKDDGTVLAWGVNFSGELGNNTTENSNVPVKVQTKVMDDQTKQEKQVDLSGIVAIAAGGSHALALAQDGTLWSWGYNYFGQLGDNTTLPRMTAVKVALPAGVAGKVTAISAGLDHSAAVADGSVYAWGYNYYGQVGNGGAQLTYDPVKTPVQVIMTGGGALANIVAITATGHHCIAQTDKGAVWTWGRNTYGQLGNGSSLSLSSAVQVIAP